MRFNYFFSVYVPKQRSRSYRVSAVLSLLICALFMAGIAYFKGNHGSQSFYAGCLDSPDFLGIWDVCKNIKTADML